MKNYLVQQLRSKGQESQDIIESLEMQMSMLVHSALDIFE
jgi:hypothetical protein